MKLERHEIYSKVRLDEISMRISSIGQLENNDLCIYTTGSYGRLEASVNSDLDLFFIDASQENPTNNIDKILINAEVIKICRNMSLPEFSKDGGYLTIHNIGKIKEELGSPSDDYYNYFTARMLLLLESKPIYNIGLHKNCLEQIIEIYYVDFHDHSKSFKPIFLSNDIIRFWKTLCLNYEHKRKNKSQEADFNDTNKSVSYSKNLKLKFSRKLTCFSFIFHLIAFEGAMSQTDILDVALMTPLQRLNSLKNKFPQFSSEIDKAIDSYQWFIDKTQIPSDDLLEWISDKNLRNDAFDRSRSFGEELFQILVSLDSNNLLNKLLI